MKIYGEITETTTRKYLKSRKCDLCGKEAKTAEWDAGCYEINSTEIKITIKSREGSDYPEGGMGTEYEIDLCPDCFRNRLVMWLIEQGAQIGEVEWDW